MNKRNELIDKFYRDVYIQENKIFQEAIEKKIGENTIRYVEEFLACIKRFLKEIAQMQNTVWNKVGCIEISFLRASVDSSDLLIALETYDEKQDMGECLIDMRSSFNWLSNEWCDLKDKLYGIREKEEWCRYINPEDIRVMLQGTLFQIFIKIIYLVKYPMQTCDTWQEYKMINRTDFFYISVGEFRDRQKLVFVDREEFDIFLSKNTIPLCYGKFWNKTYKQKVFGNIDLKGSKFINCTFERCEFKNAKFNDNIFYNCFFYHCKFSETDFSGAIVEDTVFDECDLTELNWYIPFDATNKDVDDVYRITEVKECKIIRSALRKENMDICHIVNLTLEDAIEGEV